MNLRFPILNLFVGAALGLTACGGDTGSDEDSGTEGGLTASGVTSDNSAGTDSDASTTTTDTSATATATTNNTDTSATTASTGDGDGDVDTGDGDGDPLCVPILGDCSHVPDGLVVETVLTGADNLNSPTDCEFKPDGNNELWVTNRADYSMVIVQNTMQGSQTSFRVQENFGGGVHFMAKPAALAFGQNGTLATAQQEDQLTQGNATPWDFMGPTMFTSNLNAFDGGHNGHMDMLHNSPNSSGLAWAGGNVYWVYDGTHGSLTRYDFVNDHGLGGTDHSDGVIYRALDGALGYQPGVASHVVYDDNTGYVYAADTADGWIVGLDSATGDVGSNIQPNYDGATQKYVNNVENWLAVDGNAITPVMAKPSGLEIHDGMLFASDYASGRIYAFDMDGNLIDWLETGFGTNSLMGMAFDTTGNLFVVNNSAPAVMRISLP